ncbi:MAG: hypothetical protein R3244_07545 [Thermoanaerobaculia bacterium]|nr:hypothetical protein [Thermoanaerobaculia bacterium]
MSDQERHRERTPAHWPPDSELQVGKVVLAGVALALATALASVAMWYLSVALRDALKADDPAPPALLEAMAPYEPPSPRLQVQPAEDLRALRAEERAVLESYGWVDEAAGTARVPIDRAMELLLEMHPEGRAFGTPEGSATSDPAASAASPDESPDESQAQSPEEPSDA